MKILHPFECILQGPIPLPVFSTVCARSGSGHLEVVFQSRAVQTPKGIQTFFSIFQPFSACEKRPESDYPTSTLPQVFKLLYFGELVILTPSVR